jgi:ORF6C domain
LRDSRLQKMICLLEGMQLRQKGRKVCLFCLLTSKIHEALWVKIRKVILRTTLLGVVNLMREHLAEVSATVSPLPEKLDEIVTLLQAFFATQQLQETQIARIDERTQRLTPAHARAVQELINEMVFPTRHAATPLDYYKLYGSLKHQFRVASYKEIPDERFDEVMAFLREELRKATGGAAPEQGSLF